MGQISFTFHFIAIHVIIIFCNVDQTGMVIDENMINKPKSGMQIKEILNKLQ